MKLTIKITAKELELLTVLVNPDEGLESIADVVSSLIDHAQQGIYRPGSWERAWLTQVFGDDWTEKLQPGDPYGREECEEIFCKPREVTNEAH